MNFCASIQCFDGRIHEPILAFIKENYNIPYVDMIAEPGADQVMAELTDKVTFDAIVKKLQLSIEVHDTSLVFVSGHFNCLANPVDKNKHIEQVKKSIDNLQKIFPDVKFIGLWIDENWQASPC
jgi:hypothetical protein